jgi:hypothetical protein
MAARIDSGRVQLLTRTGLEEATNTQASSRRSPTWKRTLPIWRVCGVDDVGLPSFANTQAATDGERGAPWWAASRLRSLEAAIPRRTVAVGVASDGPPAATDVASSTLLRVRYQRHRGFYLGEVLVTLRL